MELLRNPVFETGFADAFEIARPRAITQAIERVGDGFVFGEIGDRKVALPGCA